MRIYEAAALLMAMARLTPACGASLERGYDGLRADVLSGTSAIRGEGYVCAVERWHTGSHGTRPGAEVVAVLDTLASTEVPWSSGYLYGREGQDLREYAVQIWAERGADVHDSGGLYYRVYQDPGHDYVRRRMITERAALDLSRGYARARLLEPGSFSKDASFVDLVCWGPVAQ